jgi:putative aminopeptidase FrvX
MNSQSILKETSLTFLERYLNNASPTGFEAEGQKIWMDYVKPYVDTFITDTYGTAVGVINPDAPYKVVIEGHADEIAWYVNYITDDGLIYVIRNGGSDHMIAPSMRVNIHTKKGIVKGVFGWPAIHTRNRGKEETPKIENIFIDCGCETKEEIEQLGIHVGCVVTYPDEFMILNGNKFVCRAIDNRMITKTIRPNVAIVTDVCHDSTTPMIEKKIEGDTKIGKGPVITYAPAVQNNLRELIIKTAEDNKIPFQRLASSRVTGTDTDAFAYSNGGVASALISLPLRYMHTTVEMVHREDVENVIKLIYESVLNIENNETFSYYK